MGAPQEYFVVVFSVISMPVENTCDVTLGL